VSKLVRLLSLIAILMSLLALSNFGENNSSIGAIFAQALSEDQIVWPLVLALLAGFLTSLSPCVYPLIPITLTIMGARSYENHMHGFLVASSYVLGMSIIYTLLGVLFACLGILAGSIMQSTIILIIFALIFLFTSLAMLNAYQIKIPQWLLHKLSRVGGKGFSGAFLMGLVAGVIAAPCTGPVLGAILALIARDQNLAWGIFLMGSFSLGLGLPFLALGTFSSAISHIPKSGAWMNAIKYIIGAIMLALCFYFLSQAFPVLNNLFIIIKKLNITILSLIISTSFFMLIFLSKYKIIRALSALLCALIINSMFITNTKHDSSQNTWNIINNNNNNNINNLLEQARKNSQPVIIDFYASWCVACRELSTAVFNNPEVRARLSEFLLIKIDASESFAMLNILNKRFNITGLPTLIILDRRGQERPHTRILGFVAAKEFLQRIASY